jgi:hypothetical protein
MTSVNSTFDRHGVILSDFSHVPICDRRPCTDTVFGRLELGKRSESLPSPDSHGQAALMLCESLLHLLLEQHVITKEKAIEMIRDVAELAKEMTERNTRPTKNRAASSSTVALVKAIAQSIEAVD